MRKHSVRKWLHALLDLLPLVVIPVFMVYSHRHQIDSYSVQRTEYNTIHMQQQIVNGLPTSIDNYDVSHEGYEEISYLSDNQITFYNPDELPINLFYNQLFDLYETHKYYISFYCRTAEIHNNTQTFISFGTEDDVLMYEDIEITTEYNRFQLICVSNYDTPQNYVYFQAFNNDDALSRCYFKKFQFIDLTQMFGVGNEPTIDEFNTLFPNDYYAVDSNAVAYVPYTRTYNDTDIGSQIFYSLYNSVDKYFNCNKLFSFNGVYNWINFNLFGGNAPLMVDVVYQIIVYEFFMDLIFLIYSVFMFIIDFASNFLEYCFSWSHRGGR